jgi:hypothetical protein
LYTDAEIRTVAGYDPCRFTSGDEPYLVVPNGETKPLGDVLKALSLDAKRLQDPRYHGSMHIAILALRVSPSYDLICMDAFEGEMFQPSCPVYGVQIVQRHQSDLGGMSPWREK